MTNLPANEIVNALSDLTTQVETFNEQVAQLKKQRRRDRAKIVALAISVVLDVILSVVVTWFAVQADNASNEAKQASSAASLNAVNQKATCISSNEARATQTKLWNYVLDVSSRNPERQTDPAVVEQFREFIRVSFAQRDCDNPIRNTTTLPPVPTTIPVPE